MKVLLVEPFWGDSHRAFAEGYARHSRHQVDVLRLPGRSWKWRLRSSGLALGSRLRGRLGDWDVVLATSMLNLAELLAAAGAPQVPSVYYLHENQLSYPRPAGEPLERGLGLATVASLVVATRVAINSRYHRDQLLEQLPKTLAEIPDCRPRLSVRALRRSIRVVPPGLDENVFGRPGRRAGGGPPLLLWNHRWEFDKRPAAFFKALQALASRGAEFRVALLGASSQLVPKPFLAAREALGDRIVQYGFAPRRSEYRAWLRRADVVVSTAAQENFGIAVAEAIAAGAYPLLPRRLAYPELLPRRWHGRHLYRNRGALVDRLHALCREPARLHAERAERIESMRRYAWPRIADQLDSLVAEAAREARGIRPRPAAAARTAPARRGRPAASDPSSGSPGSR